MDRENNLDQTLCESLMESEPLRVQEPPRKIRRHRRGLEGIPVQTVLVILLVLLLFLTLVPLFITFIMSIKTEVDISANSLWSFPKSGLNIKNNYSKAFTVLSSPLFYTLLMDVGVTVVVMLGSCYVAFLFQWYRFRGNKLLFALFILPMLVPNVVLLTPTYLVVCNLGLAGRGSTVLGNYFGIILPYLAGNQIASVFMLRVFMRQHPKSLYEAAQIDGANKWNLFVHVCLPLAYPIMMVQGIGIFAAIYNDFLWPALVFIEHRSDGTIMSILKEKAFNAGGQGARYAMYLVSGIPLIISTAISIKFFVSGDYASGLKM